jgi:hypothetical protein
MTVNRRSLLAATAVIVPLSGCAALNSGTLDKNLADAIAKVKLVANGLQGVLSQLAAMPSLGLPSNVLASIGNYVSLINGAATSMASVTTIAAAQPVVQKIETYLNALVTVAANFLPPPIGTIVSAASLLLPIIEGLVGLVLAPSAPTARRASAAAPTMTQAQAELVLAQSATTVK